MVYCGRVEIGAYKDEGAHYVKGIHEPLISEALFEEVQDILHGRKRITKVRSTKDEHLPLRGFVVCSNCGKPITGSGANGNGGKYYYYHCQQAAACKERYRADAAHEAFIALLKSITVKSEVLELYGAIMKQYFKEQGTDRTKETKALQAQIDKLKLRIKNAQILMLDGELTAAEFKEIRASLALEIDMLERKKVSVLTADDDYEQYLERGMPLLQNIDKHWLAADLAGKQQIVGSIFSSKLIFDKNGYRTIGEHPLLELISSTSAAFRPFKEGKASISADLSGWVPRTGFEPAHPCGRCDLNTVRLPISPSGQVIQNTKLRMQKQAL